MFLGLDLGTSEVKALLLNQQQQVVAHSGAALTLQRRAPQHSEQDPQEWWQACCSVLARLRQLAPKAYAAVKAIGLSGQMHGAVLLNAAGVVLRPAILWNDTRSTAQCTALMQACPELPQLCGSIAMPGFTAPKLLWLAKHEPRHFAQIHKVLLPKDYVRWRLSGAYVSDMSDASGTLWLDVAQRKWHGGLLQACQLGTEHMPGLVEGSAVSAALCADVAATLGLPAGIPIAGGAGDNAASAIGLGAIAAGQGFVSLGTSGVIFLVTDAYRPNPASATHAFCHALQGRWHQMSVMLSAASALQWAAQVLGDGSVAVLAQEVAQLDAQARHASPLFLPYLSGERTPHNDATLRASWHGLDMSTSRAQMAYAVMEGVAFGLCDGLRALQQAGSSAAHLQVVGGGARSHFWVQMLASLLQVPLSIPVDATHGAALGAARLAWMASGATIDAVCHASVSTHCFEPNAAEHALLLPRYQRFRALLTPHSRLSHTQTTARQA